MDLQIDLNSDLGESYGSWKMGCDDQLIPLLSSANIACGWHAGDPQIMEKTIAIAKKAGVGVGAHPGFPDLLGFGRRNMAVTPAEFRAYLVYQLGAIMAFTKAAGVKLQHCKPHGAAYNMMAKDEKLAAAAVEAVASVDDSIILLTLAGSCVVDEAKKAGLKVAEEAFMDRTYMKDGSLSPRSMEGSVLHNPDEAIAQATKIARGEMIKTLDGGELTIKAHSICVHGDNPKALAIVSQLRGELEKQGLNISPLDRMSL